MGTAKKTLEHMFQMWNDHTTQPQINAMQACVTNTSNTNLKTAQKELMHWHHRLCYHGLTSIQGLM